MDLALKLGWELTEGITTIGDESVPQFVGTCPISGKGGNKAFKVTPKFNRFACWCPECSKVVDKDGKKKPGGDIIELMRRLKEIDPKQIYLAAEEVQKLFSGAGEGASNPSPKQEASPPSKDATFDPLKYLASLDAEHPALASLGLSPDTLRSAKVATAHLRGCGRDGLNIQYEGRRHLCADCRERRAWEATHS